MDSGEASKNETSKLSDLIVDWFGSALDVQIDVCNQVAVQYREGIHYITLFRLDPPIMLGRQEQILAQIGTINKITPNCIARIAVSTEFMEKIINTLVNHMNRVIPGDEEHESSESDV